jgi:hypothetical protein
MQFFINSALFLAALVGTAFAAEAEASTNQGEFEHGVQHVQY